jgi:hypothetical protein
MIDGALQQGRSVRSLSHNGRPHLFQICYKPLEFEMTLLFVGSPKDR